MNKLTVIAMTALALASATTQASEQPELNATSALLETAHANLLQQMEKPELSVLEAVRQQATSTLEQAQLSLLAKDLLVLNSDINAAELMESRGE